MDRVHEPGTSAARWSHWLRALEASLGGAAALLWLRRGAEAPARALSGSLADDFVEAYAFQQRALDPLWHRLGGLAPGRVAAAVDEPAAPCGERGRFAREWLEPQGLVVGGGLIGLVERTDRGALVILRVFGRPNAPASRARERQLVERLLPHVRTASRVEHELCALRAQVDARQGLVERLPMSVFFVDEQGCVRTGNAAAEALLAGDPTLQLRDDRLCARDPRFEAELRQQLDVACGSAERPGRCGSLALPRSGRRPLPLLALPLPTARGSGAPVAAVVVADPEARHALSPDILRGLFGLTASEAGLAASLAAGLTLSDSARALGIERETAGIHLRRILSKTRTKRPSSLLRLLLTSPAPLRNEQNRGRQLH